MPSGPRSVILLAHHFPPDNASGARRAARMARYLPQFGYRPFVVCGGGRPIAPPFSDASYVPDAATQARAGRILASATVALQRRFPYDERWPWALHAALAAEEIIRNRHVEAVISTFPPAGTHYAAAWLKQRYGLPWVADFRDPLHGNPGRWRPWMDLYDASLERYLFERATRVVAVSDVVVATWRRRYPFWAPKFELIWNGYDPEEAIAPLPIPERGYQLLVHAGALYRQRYPVVLLDSLLRLIGQGRIEPSRVRLRLLGHIADRHLFHALPVVGRLTGLGTLDVDEQTVPREEALEQAATADVLLLLDVLDGSGSSYTVPAKIFEYMRIGRPILALTGPDSPVERILARGGVPYAAIYPADPAPVVDRKLLGLLGMPSTPVEPSEWFLNNFDGRQQAGQLAGILDRIRKEPRQAS